MAKQKKVVDTDERYPLTNTKDELDVLWLLWHVIQERDVKLLHRTCSRLKAKLNHVIAPRVFERIKRAEDPFAMVEDIVENWLAKPPAAEIDLSKHGVCQVIGNDGDEYIDEYVYVEFGQDADDLNYAQRYEVVVIEQCAIQATMECKLRRAVVNVTLFKDHGFTGTTHQFVIGE